MARAEEFGELKLKAKLRQWEGKIAFSLYDLKCLFFYDDVNLTKKLLRILPPLHKICNFKNADLEFKLITRTGEKEKGMYLDNQRILEIGNFDETMFEAVESKIQLSIAVAMPPRMYFLHAGAVAYKNFGIIIPGSSFSGKTTLTREFLKTGAKYFSDDCAVIDNQGNLYPFSKTLSVRNNLQESEIVQAESLGAVTGFGKIPIGLIVFTEYAENYKWETREIGSGEAVWELAKNLFYPASMTLFPKETLKALEKVVRQSEVIYATRGEAAEAVKAILSRIDKISGNQNGTIDTE